MTVTLCPDPGAWRAWMDDPTADLAEHLSECERCRETVERLRGNAAVAARALASVAPAEPVGARRDALTLALSPSARLRAGQRERGLNRGWRAAIGATAAIAAIVVLATVPAAQTATASFLAQFRSQRFVAIQVDRSKGQMLFGHLKDLGVINEPPDARPVRVGSLAEASAFVGFPLKQADPATLPAGFDATPTINVASSQDLRFTLQKTKVQEYLRRVGRPEHPVPDRLDGATLVIGVPRGALLAYRGSGQNQQIMVGQTAEVTAGVEGTPTLEELRDYLLGLPGLPPDAVSQLRAIQDWRNTLPIPIQAQGMSWQNTTVAGAPALMVADSTGLGTAVIWQREGRIYGVAGGFRQDEVLRVANGLR